MAANPMYQFNVYRIGPEIKLGEVDISFTNASLFMVVSSLAILIIFNLGTTKKSLVPDKIHLCHNPNNDLVSVKVLKGVSTALPIDQQVHAVDGITGATMTSKGLSNFLLRDLNRYEKFLRR